MIKEDFFMFENFGIEVSIILKNAEKERYNLRHPYVGTEHLFLSLLKYDEDIADEKFQLENIQKSDLKIKINKLTKVFI